MSVGRFTNRATSQPSFGTCNAVADATLVFFCECSNCNVPEVKKHWPTPCSSCTMQNCLTCFLGVLSPQISNSQESPDKSMFLKNAKLPPVFSVNALTAKLQQPRSVSQHHVLLVACKTAAGVFSEHSNCKAPTVQKCQTTPYAKLLLVLSLNTLTAKLQQSRSVRQHHVLLVACKTAAGVFSEHSNCEAPTVQKCWLTP